LGIEERIPVLTSTVVDVAATLSQQCVQQELARCEVARNQARQYSQEVPPGLLLVPGGGARGECLQAHGRALAVARDTTGVAIAFGQEDGLDFGLEELVIESRWRGSGPLDLRRRSGGVLGQQRGYEQKQQGDGHDAPPPY